MNFVCFEAKIQYNLEKAKESFASPDQRFGMKTEVYFVSLRQ